MPLSSTKLSQLKLHIVVFIWGFTAILGDVISQDAMPLVFNRMGIAVLVVFLYIKFSKIPFTVNKKALGTMAIAGIVIAAHWVTFFHAIKISNVSVTLVCLSSAAFFTSILEPIFYKRKLLVHEVVLGIIIILAIGMIFSLRFDYFWGMLTALLSALLASIFSLINGKLTHRHHSEVISFYELFIGWLALCLVLGLSGQFHLNLIPNSNSDWIYILILSIICTAYPFIESVRVMKELSPFTVVLSINMEPVYGIALAYILLGDAEKMSPTFYLGAFIIIASLFANAWMQKRLLRKVKL